MSDEKKHGRYEWENDMADVDVNSKEFKAGYRQGYIDGMNEMADKVIERLRKINSDDGK